jgi:phage terminase small subunit
MTNKQSLFVTEYTVDFNGTQAAIRAGYSPKSARVTASQHLTNPAIQAKIENTLAKRMENIEYSANKVLEQLSLIGFAKNGDFFKRDENGKLIDPPEIDLEKLAAHPVGELTFGKVATGKDGPIIGVKKFKPPNVISGLELLGKYHKLWTDRIEHDIADDLIERLNEGRRRAAKFAEEGQKALPEPNNG